MVAQGSIFRPPTPTRTPFFSLTKPRYRQKFLGREKILKSFTIYSAFFLSLFSFEMDCFPMAPEKALTLALPIPHMEKR